MSTQDIATSAVNQAIGTTPVFDASGFPIAVGSGAETPPCPMCSGNGIPGKCPTCGVDQKMIDRDAPDPAEVRAKLVKKKTEIIQADKKKWEPRFKKMKECGDFVFSRQWSKEKDDDRYVANISQRHVAGKLSALYAKNPRMVAQRRQRLDFAIWDGNPATLQQAMQLAQQGNPGAIELIKDAMTGTAQRQMLDKVGKTLELVFQYQLDQQTPPFKKSMKQLVRRGIVCGVGYIKLCYFREMEARPETAAQIAVLENQISKAEQINADVRDGEVDGDDSSVEELRLILEGLRAQDSMTVKTEGLYFDFPQAWSIIPDQRTQNVSTFTGSRWATQEFILSPDDVERIYKVDVRTGFTPYSTDGEAPKPRDIGVNSDFTPKESDMCCVWEHYDRTTGLVYVICEGYKDFLKEPAEPDVKLKRFFPWFPITFNEIEHESEAYPQSDVEIIMPMQMEYNRAREGLREHRHAARPKTIARKGAVSEEDKEKLSNHPANALIELDALQTGQKVDDVLQAWKYPGIDPGVYDTSYMFDDIERTVGSQAANLGGTSDSTATESSIAESSRMGSIQSNIDDLDDVLTELARECGHVLLTNMDQMTAQKIAGRGAAWPQLSAEDITDDVWLEAQMGSSGRPNKAVEMANFQAVAPILLQIPGISPVWLASEALKRLDDRLDVNDALAASAPSIQAMNAMMSKVAPGAAAGPAAGTQPAGGINAPDLQGAKGGLPPGPAPELVNGGAPLAPAAPVAPIPTQGGPVAASQMI